MSDRRPGAASTIAAAWLALVVFAALTASWLPLDPNRQDLRHGREAPSWAHPLGTTRLGEDLLARVVHGSRVSLVVGVVATVVGLVVGGALGMAAATVRRWLDPLVVVLIDAAAAFPPLVLAMSISLFRGPGLATITVTVSLLVIPLFARVARTLTLGVVHRDFVVAARAGGSRPWRLMSREVLPNIAIPLVGYGFVLAGTVMLVEGALSFLGVGVGTDKTSWGQLVAAGQGELQRSPHLSLFPAAALVATVVSLSQLGDRLSARWSGEPMAPRRPARRTPEASPRADGGRARRPGASHGTGARPEIPGLNVPRLEVEALCTVLHTGEGDLEVVRDVSFTLRAGELLGLVGESGSGKSMLARSLVGLAPYGVATTFSGSVRLDGVDLLGLDPDRLRASRGRGVAHILQDPMTALDPVMRVGAQVAEQARVHRGLSRRQARDLAIDLLDRVGIGQPRQRALAYPHELSGGLRQRVAVALALAAGPSVLVADEATSALDVTNQARLADLLDELRDEHRLAVLLISHDVTLLAQRADRIAVLYAGRIVELGPAADVYGRPRHPYSAALVAAAPHLDQPPHGRLAVIEGAPPSVHQAATGCPFAARCPRAEDRCHREPPPLERTSPADGEQHDGHEVACFHPLGGGTGPASPWAASGSER